MDPDLSAAFLERFFKRTTAGIKPGLQVIEALLARLGNPEKAFIAVHVAGTNGKGSVCAMLESIFRGAGFKTGLYTSPHLVRFHERIRVNGEEITDAQVAALAAEVEAADLRMASETGLRPATFFELGTALAFAHFARAGVQIAVVETGMGGRWDATNVIHPLVSVITPISLDHQEYLGDTLEKIAGEKAGIIKDQRPVVVADQPEAVMAVLAGEARRKNAPLVPATEDVQVGGGKASADFRQRITLHSPLADYGTVTLGLLGPHQAANAALAVAAAERAFQEMSLPLDPEVVGEALAGTRWPARFQLLSDNPPVVLDGAHNPAGAEALAAALKAVFKKKPGAFVIGLTRDKDADGILKPLKPWLKRAWATAYAGDRALPPADVVKKLRAFRVETTPAALADALREAREWARANDGFVCVCGSLYLAGEVLKLPAPA